MNRDIVSRSRLDIATVRRMTDFMHSDVGNITTMDSPAAGSKISDNRTIDHYLEAITDSFVFHKVNTYDLIGKERPKVKAKYYAADVGLRNVTLNHTDDNASGILENIVYPEPLRRGYDVVIGLYRGYEADFIARIDGDT